MWQVISMTNISIPKVEEINQTELKFEYHSFRMTCDEIVQNGCKAIKNLMNLWKKDQALHMNSMMDFLLYSIHS